MAVVRVRAPAHTLSGQLAATTWRARQTISEGGATPRKRGLRQLPELEAGARRWHAQQRWADLDDAHRQQWIESADGAVDQAGDPLHREQSAINRFVAADTLLQRVGLRAPATHTAGTFFAAEPGSLNLRIPPPFTHLAVGGYRDNLQLDFTPHHCFVFTSDPVADWRLRRAKPRRQVAHFNYDAHGGFPPDPPLLAPLHQPLVPGWALHVRSIVASEGGTVSKPRTWRVPTPPRAHTVGFFLINTVSDVRVPWFHKLSANTMQIGLGLTDPIDLITFNLAAPPNNTLAGLAASINSFPFWATADLHPDASAIPSSTIPLIPRTRAGLRDPWGLVPVPA
jgi:hypothetical protein